MTFVRTLPYKGIQVKSGAFTCFLMEQPIKWGAEITVSRFHFTTGKPYTREIRTEINSFRFCQNSNNFPRLKALGIKKNIAKRKRNYFPISLVTISSWSHIQFFLSNIRFIETFWWVKKLFVVFPVYINLSVFVNPYFINIKPNLEDHEKRIIITITSLLLEYNTQNSGIVSSIVALPRQRPYFIVSNIWTNIFIALWHVKTYTRYRQGSTMPSCK